MRLLLDTHTLLWFATGAPLADRTRALIERGDSEVCISVVTPWEIAIKQAKGKLSVRGDLRQFVVDADIDVLPVTWEHTERAGALPMHHGDPFDRMLVAQAQCEGLSLVTGDVDLARYQVHVVPAR